MDEIAVEAGARAEDEAMIEALRVETMIKTIEIEKTTAVTVIETTMTEKTTGEERKTTEINTAETRRTMVVTHSKEEAAPGLDPNQKRVLVLVVKAEVKSALQILEATASGMRKSLAIRTNQRIRKVVGKVIR